MKGGDKTKPPAAEAGAARAGAVLSGAASSQARPITLHVMSDSTGNLPQHMLRAFLTQFPDGSFVIRRHPFVDTPEKLAAALEIVGATGGIVFQALISGDAKARVLQACARLGLPHCDLTGEFIEFIARASGIRPVPNVRRLHEVGDEYRRRIEALEFTLEHDDGLGLDSIRDADIVLAGVSRTSKTPTSIFLGQQGFKTANVSLAMEVDPPPQLLCLPRKQVVGLVIDPRRLVDLRTSRNTSWKMDSTRYNDHELVAREVNWSRRLFAARDWHVLDVTRHAIEENAGRIVEMLGLDLPDGIGAIK